MKHEAAILFFAFKCDNEKNYSNNVEFNSLGEIMKWRQSKWGRMGDERKSQKHGKNEQGWECSLAICI
jgi:hypothetical protein